MAQSIHEGCSYIYPLLSIARYSFIQLSELEQCSLKKKCQRFYHRSTGFEPRSSKSRVRSSTSSDNYFDDDYNDGEFDYVYYVYIIITMITTTVISGATYYRNLSDDSDKKQDGIVMFVLHYIKTVL